MYCFCWNRHAVEIVAKKDAVESSQLALAGPIGRLIVATFYPLSALNALKPAFPGSGGADEQHADSRRPFWSLLSWLVASPLGSRGAERDHRGGFRQHRRRAAGRHGRSSSPVLIEKARTVVTDGQGRYTIVDLRPGTYTITFTLTGFNTLVRDGLELPADFTATVNVQLQVGSLEETVTVSGAVAAGGRAVGGPHRW